MSIIGAYEARYCVFLVRGFVTERSLFVNKLNVSQ